MTNPLAFIIENDPNSAIIFAKSLQMAGFETEIIRDGGTALARLAGIIPAVVLLELRLPDISGKDILYHIRADERFVETRVIVATADAAMADMLQDETDLTLIKPVGVSQLRDMAARLRPGDIIIDRS